MLKKRLPYLFYDNYYSDKIESQMDYFISWTLRCAEKKYENIDQKVNLYSKMILSRILFDDEHFLNDKNVISVICGKNFPINNGHIDLWVEIQIDGIENNFVIIFENKVYTGIRNGQLEKYKNYIDNFYLNKNYQIRYILFRGDSLCNGDYEKCKMTGFNPISMRDIVEILKNYDSTGNDLFDEFWYNWFISKEEFENLIKNKTELFGKSL